MMQTPTSGRGTLPVALALILMLSWMGIVMPSFGTANLALLMLLPVVIAASSGSRAKALLVAVLAGALFNFVALEPRLTFDISKVGDLVTLGVYLAVAFITATVSARLAAAGEMARRQAKSSAYLARHAQLIARAANADRVKFGTADLLRDVTGHAVDLADCPASLARLPMADEQAARWAFAHRDVAGKGAAVLAAAEASYVATHSGRRPLMARILGPLPDAVTLDLCRQLLDGAANALDRLDLIERLDTETRAEEATVMREALIASIAHDLRTPLASIRAGLETLQTSDIDQLALVREETLRLERTLANLLDLARLQSANQPPQRVAMDLTDSIAAAVDAFPVPARSRVRIVIDPETPLVASDAVMVHHILVNLIENALKYSPVTTPVTVSVTNQPDGPVILSVSDEGPGLGPDVADLFTLFRRGANADQAPGSGVGLSVVDAFARALGHRVEARDRTDSPGASFSVHFAPWLPA